MRYLFSKNKNNNEKEQPDNKNVPKVDLPSAIMKNKEAIGTLEKRQSHLEKRCADLTNEARQRIARKDKEGAKLALKRKQMLDAELTQLGNARLTLEQQINTLESQQTQQMAVKALSHGVEVQKALNSSLNISSIDKLMDDLQDQQDRQQEVAQVLSQNIPLGDEDELLAELGRMEEEELDKQLVGIDVPTAAIGSTVEATPTAAGVATAAAAPLVVTSTSSSSAPPVASKSISDEEQLRRLEAELA